MLAADHDPDRVARLRAGKAPLFEPGLDELLGKGLGSGRLHFTPDVAGAVRGRRDVLLMFDTPVNDRDESDLAEIFATAGEIAPGLEPDTVVLVTAQVPVGTCDGLAQVLREKNPAARAGLAYSPENLRLGQAIDRFLHPALPVIGADDPATLDRVEGMLSLLGVRWQRVSLRTAEMTKHALNAFLALSVCFGNELGSLCDEVGADGLRIAELLRLEPRIGAKAMLRPGLGFSGGTLARDVQALRGLGDRCALETPLLDGAWDANRAQNGLVRRKLERVFGRLDGLRVVVLGLTYKAHTSTLRRSAALEIISDLARRNVVVTAHDPRVDRGEIARHHEFRFVEDVYRAVEGARALVLVTGWPEYRNLAFDRIKGLMAQPVIIDTANMLDGEQLAAIGFTYLDVGRGRIAGAAR